MQDEELEGMVVRPEEAPWATDGVEVPTIYADDIRGASVLAGVARLNLVEHRLNPVTNELTTRIVAVLAVPLETVVNWGPFFTKHFSDEFGSVMGMSTQ
ncbi:hypothetical protein [Sphingomonas segetis]|jgi:hypothetical protein|uniref:hypothetical protein n=1 Tax=Sphingomonas segetis TaxID=1104779 RepID=UPI0012D2BD83|nr:hypothetical protein [Sphingomonas segetis]